MAHQKEFAVADDDGKKIVEVVCDTARQLTHRLHFLRLRDACLERLLLGYIEKIERKALRVRNAAKMDFGQPFVVSCGMHENRGRILAWDTHYRVLNRR